jgi:hypothetical protein
MPWVAVAALATQAPLPSENAIVAATTTPIAPAINSQCQDAATARRNSPGSPHLAARIACAMGRRTAQNIVT